MQGSRNINQKVRTMWDSWPMAPDEAQINNVEVFTDGAAELTSAWPKQATRAGWAAIFLTYLPGKNGQLCCHWLGALWGPVVCEEGAPGPWALKGRRHQWRSTRQHS